MRELADRPELWIDFVRHDASQRVYEELLSDAHVTAWLICWMDDHDTGFHDHDVSAGAVAVVSGERARGAPGDRRRRQRQRTLRRRRGLSLLAPSDIHRVRHGGSDPAVTLHVYSPPLRAHGRLRDRRGRRARAPHDALLAGAAPARPSRRRAARASVAPLRRGRVSRLCAGAALHAGLAGDQDRADHLRREQAMLDDARLRAEPARPARAGRRPARGSRRSGRRRGSWAHRAARPGRAPPACVCTANGTSSSGTGARQPRDELLLRDDHDEPRAAAATIFSRVCAAPPPLISQPCGSTWSAPSIARSSSPSSSSVATRQAERARRPARWPARWRRSAARVSERSPSACSR